MKFITIILPYPPSDNEKYVGRTTKTLSPVVRAYRRAVETVVIEKKVPRITCNVEARLLLFPANERRDSSNCLKVLWDTLEHVGVLKNDRQVKEVHVFRGVPHPSDVICLRLLPWTGPVPDDPQTIAEQKGSYVSESDLDSVRAKVQTFDKTMFKKGKVKR